MITYPIRSLLVCSVALAALAGCAAHGAGTRTIASRLVQGKPEAQRTAQSTPSDMGEWIARMREIQANAKPGPRSPVLTAEALNPALREAIARVNASPTSANQVAAAVAYYRAGILDAAQDRLTEALRLDSSNAGAYELRARIWRNWGFPDLAIADAHRAVYFAPRSPEAMNTLGTVFLAMGRRDEARSAYLKALELDVWAAYAWSNVCHVAALDGDLRGAELACRKTLELDPRSVNARKNLDRVRAAVANAESPDERRP